MAHPDHDQVIGRLVGARLRGAAPRDPGRAAAAEVHPDAETWAAYVDGGLLPDEVNQLEAHLGGCAACRRLVAGLTPEVSAVAAPGARDAEATPAGGAVVIPFPRRRLFAWMGIAAGLFGAVTLWSVSRLGREAPDAKLAQSLPTAEAPVAAPAAPPEATTAPAAAGAVAPPSPRADATRTLNRIAAPTPPPAMRSAVDAEQDKLKADVRRSEAGRQRGAGSAAGATAAEAGAVVGDRVQEGAKASEEKRLAEAAPAPAPGNRVIQLQTNSVSGGATHGPVPTQQAANQQQNVAGNIPVPAAPPPAPAAPPAPVTAPAPAPVQADAAAAPRERPGNEQPVGQVAEIVSTTSGLTRGRAAAARPQPAQAAAAGADRDGQARAKDETAKRAAFATTEAVSVAMPMFAEPGGRLQWRIADGRRIESSSDGGTTWNRSHNARSRLRAGTAPSLDSAWAVGERGLVVRLSVPGGWAAVSRPADVTLIAVSATSAQSARVTAEDGRVFETADGGATWTPATPGAGPQ